MISSSPSTNVRSVSSAPDRLAQLGRLLATLKREPADMRFVPRYVGSRGSTPLGLHLPWLPFSVIEALERATGGARVFEYGGGGSTLWFGARAAQVVTVEHDAQWNEALAKATSHMSNVEIMLRPLNSPGSASYVSAIDGYEDAWFDLVSVDGRHRVECVRRAMTKVRPGGMLLLDDSERLKYAAAGTILAGWTARNFFGLVPCKDRPGTTTIFTKPPAPPVFS